MLVMGNKNFKDSIKVSNSTVKSNNTNEDKSSTEALYLYVDSSLQEILSFLRSFYQKNPENVHNQDLHGPSRAESFYYSLDFELSHAYRDFLDGKLDIHDFKAKIDSLFAHYKTNPVEIYETQSLVKESEKSQTSDLSTIIDTIESRADSYWEKMKQEQENQEQK